MPVPLLNPLRSEKPWLLMILGLFIVITSALAISSGLLDSFKTTKTGEPPLLIGEVTTIDDAISDLRGIGVNILEAVVMKSDKTPTQLTDYNVFRSYAYRKGMVYKLSTLGETMLYTYDENNDYYSWVAPGQTTLLTPKYSQLIIANTTCVKVNGGWQITMTFRRDDEYGDSLNRVTINGLEVRYPNYSANAVLQNNISTDLVYQGTYLDGVIYSRANIWISDRMDYHSGESILVRIRGVGGFAYAKIVSLP
jgi:hypothetical protein